MSWANHNILHIQVPFSHISAPSYKIDRYDAIVCNSLFTKEAIDPHLGARAIVIYPPVDISKFSSSRKTKTIVSVGRFSSLYQAKKQEVLIEAFQQGIDSGILKGFTLALAGGLLPSDDAYFSRLTKSATGYPITFFKNCSFDDLRSLYSHSLIYWHAAGFGETLPTHMEHFGMSTVEAMKSGCVPVVFNGGGQPEIVRDNENGFLFRSIKELLEKTERLIRNPIEYKTMAQAARRKAEEFSTDRFCRAYDELLLRITTQ
jgi:glycosyltransferase involved in cell wall biosynthesis